MSHIIQINVPICPKCTALLRHDVIGERYFCYDCRTIFNIVEEGQNEREFICEEQSV